MALTVALAGDTMLGRGVAEEISSRGPTGLFSPEVKEVIRSADLCILNLECCISERGTRWPDPRKPFFFRAPPSAVETLLDLGVDCVTLANNHALDFGVEALLDTLELLEGAGIAVVGAGADREAARLPVVLARGGDRLGVLGFTDHPASYAAGPGPGVAFAELGNEGVPAWIPDAVRLLQRQAGIVLVTPHWGPNMTITPHPHVRKAADALLEAGATLIAGHSAHVFHGLAPRVIFDLGDFIDDYAVDPRLRNDLGVLYLVELDPRGPQRVEAVPLALDYCFTRLASDEEARWIGTRLEVACREWGTTVTPIGGRLVVSDF